MFIHTLLVFFCSFLYGVSAVLCKYGLQNRSEYRISGLKSLLLFLIRNRVWLLGVGLSLATNLAILELQSLIDISVVYPILNFSYIFVLLLGYKFLDELLSKRQWLGVFTVVVGTLLIIFIDEPATGSETNVSGLLQFSCVSFLVIVGIIGFTWFKKVENYEICYALCTGLSFGNVETYIKATTNMVLSEVGEFSIFSTDSLLQFVSVWPFAMMVIFGIVGWVCMQITYSHGDVSVSVPLFAVLQSCVTLSCGYFIFGEAFTFQKVLGILTIVSGVLMLVFSTVQRFQTEPAQ